MIWLIIMVVALTLGVLVAIMADDISEAKVSGVAFLVLLVILSMLLGAESPKSVN